MKQRGLIMTGTNFEYDNVTETLRESIVKLSFVKLKDGQVRNMRATLNDKFIPEEQKPTQVVANEKKETVRVYDLDVEGWRSFRVNSLQTFEPI
jgi:hypothetical protein